MFAFENLNVSAISESFTETYLTVLLLISHMPSQHLVFACDCVVSVLVC